MVVTLPLAVLCALGIMSWGRAEAWATRAVGVPADVLTAFSFVFAYSISFVAVRALARARPRFLSMPEGYSSREALGDVIVWSIPTYVVLALVFGWAAWKLVPRQDEHWFLIVQAFAFVVPLWFTVPLSVIIVSWRENRA
jgi:uncharacterized membrane protein YbjE (DUF340 family)